MGSELFEDVVGMAIGEVLQYVSFLPSLPALPSLPSPLHLSLTIYSRSCLSSPVTPTSTPTTPSSTPAPQPSRTSASLHGETAPS